MMKQLTVTFLFLALAMSGVSFAMGNYRYMGNQAYNSRSYQPDMSMDQQDMDVDEDEHEQDMPMEDDQDLDNHVSSQQSTYDWQDSYMGQMDHQDTNSSQNGNPWWNEQDMGHGNHYGFNMRQLNGPQVYNEITVDISEDIFVNPGAFNRLTGGTVEFVDENGDDIIDYAQDTPYFESLGIGPFQDENGDSIYDGFQTFSFYRSLGMKNFVDLDGDGLCDNYEANPFSSNATNSTQNRWLGMRVRNFGRFMVNTDEDIFVNPGVFNRIARGMLTFVDENGDGICDYFQDTTYFQSLGLGQFVDENGDTIHDPFQTYGFYKAVGMNNFVDVDGDGICDNYEANPTTVTVNQ